jgi:hypothetical protein
VDRGVLHEGTARFFGPDLRLHRHQEDAIRIALRGEPVIVTTGTGLPLDTMRPPFWPVARSFLMSSLTFGRAAAS